MEVGLYNINTKNFQHLISTLATSAHSISVCKLPSSPYISVLIDSDPTVIDYQSLELETLRGFLVAPFEPEANPTFLIKNEYSGLYFLHLDGEVEEIISPNEAIFKKNISQKSTNTNQKFPFDADTEKERFVKATYKGIESIAQGELKKVVFARKGHIELKPDFNLVDYYIKLCVAYPHSFVSLVMSPLSGIWIGASPEIIVSVDKDSVFKTVSLAATKPIQNNDAPSKTTWTEKEIEEQALVSRYIINCFKKIRLREYDEEGPKTIRAGNLLHLKTEFSVNTAEVNFENLGTVMLKLLHPTSALCGMPKQKALELIKQYEHEDRKYYSGFWGMVNMATNDKNIPETHLYVNIRCMNIIDNQAILYAGAGITLDSDPESEWLETENKLLTLASKL